MSHEAGAASSAFAISKELKRRRPRIRNLKLHKLLFFIQAEHLAWYGIPAFSENIEAWKKGPVVADVWRGKPAPGAESRDIPEQTNNVMTSVLARFAGKGGGDLVDLTHDAGPWVDVTDGGANINNQIITHEAMKRYAQQLPEEWQPLREALRDAPRDREFIADAREDLDSFLAT